jgi:NADP-dependent aldehyde dehydrogenase
MPVSGRLIVGYESIATPHAFHGVNAASGAVLEPPIAIAGAAEVARAAIAARRAFDPYRHAPLAQRARFLEVCGEQILELGDELIERAAAETGLPRARLEGERARTVGQLKLFAEVVRQGDFLGLRVDHALPERKPLPRADLRQRKIPVGPVAVFGASNFPLAFSAAGGDVASALAAGCPVVVKGHPAHPGTSELAAQAISAAARACELPDGTYSHLSGPGTEIGRLLVSHSAIAAVGFTGSRAGGLALVRLAAERSQPIPVFAEMSSINPVIVLPGAMAARGPAIAAGFIGSLTLGVGQFCTNPGLVLFVAGPDSEAFAAAAAQALAKTPAAQMLSAGISRAYHQGVSDLERQDEVRLLARGTPGREGEGHGALFRVRGARLLAHPGLAEEVFGPSSLVVECADIAQLEQVLESLEGQLTATLHLESGDEASARRLLPILERKAGRILTNGWPTGVEVSPAMVHGGPFPATSDSRSSSVGTLAIERFLRPVCYQDLPAALLPHELQDSTARYRRLIDGTFIAAAQDG